MITIFGKKLPNTIMNKNHKNAVLRDKILKGTRLAVKRLITESKKRNDFLVIFRRGKIVKVRARELK